ncbi:hypothetical protein G647_00841 [Cladophialophora carrionii CBS 160.54]|uniref:Mediator of RNA polymerase II transcription subunit 14 n=1 Tax=Cladophialophora carrionii CBS 160.54 TaxID=1279043 RepID=V9DR33_9EURO|nr:uncharacterized protein G647_00841 [Cladophialophora carrionii CBS 160.54]ETI28392.1 hypothetical protein G647_00841 [Cladophialophora carrionii CBS 160.54]
MNGERPTVNGAHTANGTHQSITDSSSSANPPKPGSLPQNLLPPPPPPTIDRQENGDAWSNQWDDGGAGHNVANIGNHAPPEILSLISQDSYLPMAALISRASQTCWNGLSDLVEQLASLSVPDLPPEQAKLMPNGFTNNQSKANLDKKDKIFKFANEQKADFIKLLVLLQWSKNVDEVSKTISINYWLMLRRQAYWGAIASMASLKQESSNFQIPNPDLKTAAEVLSTGRVGNFPRLGYITRPDLSPKQILRVLKSLDQALSVRLALSDNIPPQLRNFRVHDGRATFIVPNEFELDLSTLDESFESPLRMVDFRLSFQPCPHLPDRLQSEIELLANSNIDQGGLGRCYEFLHELALSYKLAEFHTQGIELSRNQWVGNLRVELIRRNLIVQYWPERHGGKSWVEIGITSGRGRQRPEDLEPHSSLEIKCTWHGKRAETLHLHVNESVLCFEDILRQVVAQHSTQILDTIYDKLVSTPLFADAELSLEQSLSHDDPEVCSLVMQLSRSSTLQLKVDPVTGLIMVSPVTERAERLQFEVNRVQSVADEVVSKLLNFRCSVRESTVLAGISGTRWEALRSFKFTQAEIKSLFGRPVVRINMFRQSQWGLEYSLAVTHCQDGDHWWLLQQIPLGAASSQARYKVLRSQRIGAKEELSSAYFDRLADYSMGLICIQRNADFLMEKKEKFGLRPFPAFDRFYELPELSFDLDLARPLPSGQSLPAGAADSTLTIPKASEIPAKDASLQRNIQVRFGGVDRSDLWVMTVAQYQTQASSAVLGHLDKSVLDARVKINPEDRMVTIRVATPMAEAAIPQIIARVLDLEKVVSTVEQIHCLLGLKLKRISNSTISMVYHQEAPTELGLNITLTSGSPAPRLEFFPHQLNPHQILSQVYTKTFAANRAPFATTMRNLLTSLTATLPLLTILHKLQQRHEISSKTDQQQPSAEPEDYLRVHVLARTETQFAVQYFMPAGQAANDTKNDSPPQLLARFEILSEANHSGKTGWLVRPALEEFQSYSRPSYSSPDLADKVKQEIFSQRTEGQSKWFQLDRGAWCTVDRPEPLLNALHDVVWNWAKQAKMSGANAGSKQDSNKGKGPPGNLNANNPSVTNGTNNRGPGPAKGPPGRQQAANNAMPNGANMKVQRPPLNAPGGRPAPGNPKTNARNPQGKDVITLD